MENEMPLISVIVPIYNVEKYVRKCLDSLKAQTMKQIEVICIDDGSTDKSGKIADEYKNENGWPIFRIIHTENRGLSAVRNRGIDEARAEWLMFVDSDDWVDREFCEIPYKAAIENKADMVIFGGFYEKGFKKNSILRKDAPAGIVEELTAHEFGGAVAWNKLYKKILFSSIRYPEGRVYEDIAATHKLVHIAAQILLLEECLYHHVSRGGSITKTHSIDNKRDGFVMSLQRKNDLISFGYPGDKLKKGLYGSAIVYLSVCSPSNDPLFIQAKEIVDSVVGIPRELTWKQKVGLIVWKIDPSMFQLFMRIVHRL